MSLLSYVTVPMVSESGTAESPGTMLFCLGDEMNHPGAYELPLGTPLRHLYETSVEV